MEIKEWSIKKKLAFIVSCINECSGDPHAIFLCNYFRLYVINDGIYMNDIYMHDVFPELALAIKHRVDNNIKLTNKYDIVAWFRKDELHRQATKPTRLEFLEKFKVRFENKLKSQLNK